MFKITFKCPECGKLHKIKVDKSEQGKIKVINCYHQKWVQGMGCTGKFVTITNYFYIQLPKMVNP